jgi:hypothetical protein
MEAAVELPQVPMLEAAAVVFILMVRQIAFGKIVAVRYT